MCLHVSVPGKLVRAARAGVGRGWCVCVCVDQPQVWVYMCALGKLVRATKEGVGWRVLCRPATGVHICVHVCVLGELLRATRVGAGAASVCVWVWVWVGCTGWMGRYVDQPQVCVCVLGKLMRATRVRVGGGVCLCRPARVQSAGPLHTWTLFSRERNKKGGTCGQHVTSITSSGFSS